MSNSEDSDSDWEDKHQYPRGVVPAQSSSALNYYRWSRSKEPDLVYQNLDMLKVAVVAGLVNDMRDNCRNVEVVFSLKAELLDFLSSDPKWADFCEKIISRVKEKASELPKHFYFARKLVKGHQPVLVRYFLTWVVDSPHNNDASNYKSMTLRDLPTALLFEDCSHVSNGFATLLSTTVFRFNLGACPTNSDMEWFDWCTKGKPAGNLKSANFSSVAKALANPARADEFEINFNVENASRLRVETWNASQLGDLPKTVPEVMQLGTYYANLLEVFISTDMDYLGLRTCATKALSKSTLVSEVSTLCL
jgi:hypothetical protein